MIDIADIPQPTARQVMAVRGYFQWNQAEAASHLDVGRSTLTDIERGARKPQFATVAKIGMAMLRLGIKIENGNLVLPP